MGVYPWFLSNDSVIVFENVCCAIIVVAEFAVWTLG